MAETLAQRGLYKSTFVSEEVILLVLRSITASQVVFIPLFNAGETTKMKRYGGIVLRRNLDGKCDVRTW